MPHLHAAALLMLHGVVGLGEVLEGGLLGSLIVPW